jgi:hypothetical protein
MWGLAQIGIERIQTWKYRRAVHRALALNLRGEVRSDGLSLLRVRNHIEIQWRSREIHPWDADLPVEYRARLFHEQLMADTEAAILRLFEAFPQIDRIDLQVLDPASDNVIVSGAVHRSDLDEVGNLISVRMRLQGLGITFSSGLTP